MNEVSFSQKLLKKGKRSPALYLRALPIAMAKAGYPTHHSLARRAGFDPGELSRMPSRGVTDRTAAMLAATLGVSVAALEDSERLRLEEDKIRPAQLAVVTFPIPGLARCAERAGFSGKGWQSRLAKKIGVYPSKISPWLAGKNVRDVTAAKVAAALGCSIADLQKSS